MFDPPISAAANIFIIFAVGLISMLSAIISVDFYKNTLKKKDSEDSE